ncbi:disintegrin and metalloproteinase domain-containing protein 9 [Protopterus annectens]|uniref:disintegrin and metalloproteinase domain-containing protein 9 n=1 Tax=Protopterus annectens TaxID=7888 RepID=UPI001CFAF6F5|nr:disintegrin and metalloproteinase domain-containing protein 9 [Protopterus annectens]
MALSLNEKCLVGLLLYLGACYNQGFMHNLPSFAFRITVPRELAVRERRDASSSAIAKDQVSYVIPVDGREYKVHLEKNNDFLPPHFRMFTYSSEGVLLSEQLDIRDHCHYRGYVEGFPDSVAALSNCDGLRGFLQILNDSYGIEPLEASPSSEHLFYNLNHVPSEPSVCGVSNTVHSGPAAEEYHFPFMADHLRKKRAILPQTRYVELFLVVDKKRFDFVNRNETAVREEMIQLASYLDSIYIMLNVRIVLVGLEIWTDQNKVNTDGNAGEVLSRFVQWREKELLPRRRHDSAQLILKTDKFGATAGMAFVGTICSRSHGGGINVFSSRNTLLFASVVAHELGHNLGMNHDDQRDCSCGASTCIMNSGTSATRNFSSCSLEDFERLILGKSGNCLLNIPKPDETYSLPYCGNKLVDAGEECDCGTPEECEKDVCCEVGTCKLKSWADCAYGECCRNCRFLPAGTVCRSSVNDCDLPEYCNGSSQFCQPDVFIQNGYPCLDSKAYCYDGVCQNYDAQCRAIFGSKAKAAVNACFRQVNSIGDRFGNCGYRGNDYRKCSTRNALCGKLQCENVGNQVPVFGIKPSISQTPVGDTMCWGVDFQLGSDVPDPGMVNEGTKCEEGKVCMNYECVNASILNYDCDVENKCNGHGMCNSNKNCHCNQNWGPPDCEKPGYGGSIDSGPTYDYNNTSTRDGLLVFFLLVLPLLILAGFVFARRNALKSRFCGRRRERSQSYVPDGRSQPNAIQQARAAPSRSVLNSPGKEEVMLLPANKVSHTSQSASTYAPRPPPQPLISRPPPAPQQRVTSYGQMSSAAQEKLVPSRPAPPRPV